MSEADNLRFSSVSTFFHSSLTISHGSKTQVCVSCAVKPPRVSVTTVWLRFSLSSQPAFARRGVYPESFKARGLRMGVAVGGDSGVGAYVSDISVSECLWAVDIKVRRVRNWCFGEFRAALKIIFSTTQATGHCSKRLSTIHNRQYTH